ncbi:MAG: cysteine desulfurase family protein [Nitrospirota bacterium]
MPIYLDHIAATPLLTAAKDAMMPFWDESFGNPQSRHEVGDAPKAAIETARKSIAELIGADPREIIFTASASEANNLAIKGILSSHKKRGRHIITSVIEHFSVAHPIKRMEQEGYQVTWLPVDQTGRVNPADVKNAICKETVLISIAHANNEIGTIQPIQEIAKIANASGVPFHTDAAATVGVIPFDINSLGVDLAGFSAQQFYGPKGVGALYLRRGTRIFPLIDGGIQEGGRRAGTENVPAIVGMGVAGKAARENLTHEHKRLSNLRDHLISGLIKKVNRIHLTGDRQYRLPHIASFAVEYVDGEALIRALSRSGIIAAAGSSCSADALKISPTLTAIGYPANIAQGAIVMSLGKDTTREDIDTVLSVFPEVVSSLQEISPIYSELSGGASAASSQSR